MATEQDIQALVNQYISPLVLTDEVTPSETYAVGIMVGVYLGGTPYYFSFGVKSLGGEAPDRFTLFQIGSVTKVITTTILGMQPFLLNMSPPSAYYDATLEYNIPTAYQLQSWQQNITFKQLATFTAGINPSSPQDESQSGFIDFIDRIPAPSSGLPAPNKYSNSSVGLIGQTLIAQAGFSDYSGAAESDQWYRENLFDVLCMNSTGHFPPKDADISTFYAFDPESWGYTVVPQADWVPWGTAGRLLSNANDMIQFIMANVGVTWINQQQVPSAITMGMQQAQFPWTTAGTLGQGFAWTVFSVGNKAVAQKNGGLPGCSAYVAVCSETQCGVVALANTGRMVDGGSPMASALTSAVKNLMTALVPLASK